LHPGRERFGDLGLPFEKVWPLVDQWLNDGPDIPAKDRFQYLPA
jgi:hypothetical protein